jgi:hypothetical protein
MEISGPEQLLIGISNNDDHDQNHETQSRKVANAF